MSINGIPDEYKTDGSDGLSRLYGTYVGFVKSNQDAQKMGRLQVYIPELGGDPDNSASWYTVSYASPFAGATNVNNNKAGSDMASTQCSYGMWMVPPDTENEVLVCFANGDTARGFWFACLYQQFMNHMVPGVGCDTSATAADNKPALPPVCEYNKKDPAQSANYWQPQRPTFTPLMKGLDSQGLRSDVERGPGTTSARREAPSQTFGFLTPRGNTIHIDDNPTNEFIRLRTRSGAQILIHETTGYIYIISREGYSWMEISDIGIDMYSKRSISMRAEENVNIHADNSIIMCGKGAVHTSAGNITESSKGQIHSIACGEIIRHSPRIRDNSKDPLNSNGQTKGSTGVGKQGATAATGASGAATGSSGPTSGTTIPDKATGGTGTAVSNDGTGNNFGLSGVNTPSSANPAVGSDGDAQIAADNAADQKNLESEGSVVSDGAGTGNNGTNIPTGDLSNSGSVAGTSGSGAFSVDGPNYSGDGGGIGGDNNSPGVTNQDGTAYAATPAYGQNTFSTSGGTSVQGDPSGNGGTVAGEYNNSSSTAVQNNNGYSGSLSYAPDPSTPTSTPANSNSESFNQSPTTSTQSVTSNSSPISTSNSGPYTSTNAPSVADQNYFPTAVENTSPPVQNPTPTNTTPTTSSTSNNTNTGTATNNGKALSPAQLSAIKGTWQSTNGSKECVAAVQALGTDAYGNKLGPTSNWYRGTTITESNYKQFLGQAVATANQNGNQYSSVGGVHGNATHAGFVSGWNYQTGGPIITGQWIGGPLKDSSYGPNSGKNARYGTYATIIQGKP